jgi:hypothetical protein
MGRGGASPISWRRLGAWKWFAIMVPLGFIGGCAIAFIHANTDPLELQAAAAKGDVPWSIWGLVFTIPFGFFGATVGCLVAAIVSALTKRRRVDGRV